MERENDFFILGIAKLQSQKCASILFALNCLIPGFGTMMSACMDTSGNGVHKRSLIYGFLQMCFAIVYLLGWFWSIYHGFLIYTHAADASE